ncbi:MAG TPA: YqgE/AlgH family protein [Candidatus Polarisedimenticolaceae bacterium]|nr:YqgE/AlgH family protein [Candidatus Polarisedimenticolaceae bacterium]
MEAEQDGRTLAPGFLIAVPQLLDPNFRQSVVLLLQQNDEGALGLVVNRESPILLRDLCKDHDIRYAGDPEKHVRVGGPVQPEQGLVLYDTSVNDPEGRQVLEGLQVSASTKTLTRLCGGEGIRFQCYSGYAGWGPGQLERELSEGSWIVANVDPSLVFDMHPDEVWIAILRANGLDPNLIVPGEAD